MSSPPGPDGSLVRLLDKADLPDDVRPVAEAAAAQYGQQLNTWRALYHRPDIFGAYFPFLRAVAGPGTLDPRLKDLCALLVGWLNECRYTVSHRCTSALRNGATVDDVERVASGDWDEFEEPLRLGLELTRQITESPTRVTYRENPGLITKDLRDALVRHFTAEQLVELALNVSVWNALSRFHRIMEFPLDMPEPPAALDERFIGAAPATPSDDRE